MPDSWIDRDELASLAGELSRKKRRLSNRGVGPSRARNRSQDREGAASQEAPRSVESDDVPPLEVAEVESEASPPAVSPESEATDALVESVPEVGVTNELAESEPEAEVVDELAESAPEAETVDALAEPLPEAEVADVLAEPPADAEVADDLTEPLPDAEVADVLAESASEVEVADDLTEPLPDAEVADDLTEPLPDAEVADVLAESVSEVEVADELAEPLPEAEVADVLAADALTELSLDVEPPDPFLGGFCETANPDDRASPEDLEDQPQAMPLESLAPPESLAAEADFPFEEEGEGLVEKDLLEQAPEGAEAREGVLTNLSIAEPDPEAVRNRTPLFLREAESLLEGAGDLSGEVDDAVALRSLAAARARADQGGLLKEVLAGQGGVKLPADPGSDPVASPPPPEELGGPNLLAAELPPLESLFELDTPHEPDPVEADLSFAESGPPGQGARPLLEAAMANGAEAADEPMAYESADESLPWRLAQFAFAFASGTDSRNVCIVDEAGYPLHEDNPELRLRSRGAELAFFPDPRLTGGSELSAAQAFLAGRWHGIIRGAAPCRHLFLRFDREDPLETAEMENWSHHLVKTLA